MEKRKTRFAPATAALVNFLTAAGQSYSAAEIAEKMNKNKITVRGIIRTARARRLIYIAHYRHDFHQRGIVVPLYAAGDAADAIKEVETVFCDPKVRIRRSSTIDPETGCWNWSNRSNGGYGSIGIGSRTDGTHRTVRAHRYSYQIFKGKIADDEKFDGTLVMHICDNRACVNPDHLILGSYKDNMVDCKNKNRLNTVHGENHSMAKLTEADVISARRLRSKGETYAAIAKRFGVAESTITSAIKGHRWARVHERSHGAAKR